MSDGDASIFVTVFHRQSLLPDMPRYVYRRDDGTTFETQQKITEDPLDECPETGQPVERIITGSPGVIFDADGNEGRRDGPPTASCSGPMCGL